MNRVLFFPQNETHVENMLPVAEALQLNNEVVFIDATELYRQKITIPNSYKQIRLHSKRQEGFYRLSFFSKIGMICWLWRNLKNLVNDYDSFVFGNDGALQRILIYYANKCSKKTYLLLDGMISDYTFSLFDVLDNSSNKLSDLLKIFKYKMILTLNSLFIDSIITPFLPSIVGKSKVNKIFVIGEHSKQVVETYNLNSIVINSGLPRFSKKEIDFFEHKYDILNLCYLTSAFKWHSLIEYDKYQHKDIEMLCAVISKLDRKINLMIKIHPREKLSDYLKYLNYDFVTIENKKSLIEVFPVNDIFFSSISTGIVEAMQYDLPVYSLFCNFPYWKFKRSFLANNKIQKIKNIDEIRERLESYDIGKEVNSFSNKNENIFINDNEYMTQMIQAEINEK